MEPLLITHALSGILMITIPIGLGIILTRKFKKSAGIWWIGGLTFIISQVGHIPFNAIINIVFERGWLPKPTGEWALVFFAGLWGLSSGLWEEWFRWIAYRFWSKKAQTWRGGIILGAGHGGMEAIILGLLSLITLINIYILRGADLTSIIPPEQMQLAEQQLAAYWSQPWFFPLLGTVERVFTIPFHITASVIVLQAFRKNKIRWVWVAVFWHSLINAVGAVYLPTVWREYSWWPYAVEGLFGIIAIINITILYLLRQPEPEVEEIPPLPLEPFVLRNIPDIEETPDQLENTRYT